MFDKSLNQLRALGIEVPKANDQPKASEEAKKEEGEQITETQNEEEKLDDATQKRIYKMQQAVQNKQITLQEWIIDSDVEAVNITKMYFKQIAKALDPNRKQKKKATIADASASESETDDDGEMIEKMYITENYGQGKNDEKHT